MIEYIKGDATRPDTSDGKTHVIAHVCNNLNAWGRGFVLAISKRWAEPEKAYRSAFQREELPALGEGQVVHVERNLFVANLIAQNGFASKKKPEVIDYVALEVCLNELAKLKPGHVHMPRIGCGLGGGTWDKVEPIIQSALCQNGIPVTVYDFP